MIKGSHCSMEQESCIRYLITGLAGSTWSMFTTAQSLLTARNWAKLHYSDYSLPPDEEGRKEGRKRGPRQEISISQSLYIDTWEWEWIAIDGFWLTKRSFFLKSMTSNNKIRSLLISPTYNIRWIPWVHWEKYLYLQPSSAVPTSYYHPHCSLLI